MSRRRPTGVEWRVIHQSIDRMKYRQAGAILEAARNRPDTFAVYPDVPRLHEGVAPVKVYHPDGTLKEVVPAQQWRRRYGNPFGRRVRRPP